ncbi:MAG: isopentenyl-diphosphate Delta-isomerase [Micromonosporaceae bacterium]
MISSAPSSRESHLVEIVDPSGTPLGETTVAHAHTAPGVLHRAYSVVVMDRDGRAMWQRRAAAKTRFPQRWSNTCCGHPAPGQPVKEAAAVRLAEEMGLRDVPLTEVGSFVYQALDPETGRMEYEYDHVLVGRVDPDAQPAPDPAEADAWRWMAPPDVAAELAEDPDSYTPWVREVVRLIAQ